MFDDNFRIIFNIYHTKRAVGTIKNLLGEAILMSTHNVCFYGEL